MPHVHAELAGMVIRFHRKLSLLHFPGKNSLFQCTHVHLAGSVEGKFIDKKNFLGDLERREFPVAVRDNLPAKTIRIRNI